MLISETSQTSLALLKPLVKRPPLRPSTKPSNLTCGHAYLRSCDPYRVDVSQRDKLGAIGVAKAQQEMKVK